MSHGLSSEVCRGPEGRVGLGYPALHPRPQPTELQVLNAQPARMGIKQARMFFVCTLWGGGGGGEVRERGFKVLVITGCCKSLNRSCFGPVKYVYTDNLLWAMWKSKDSAYGACNVQRRAAVLGFQVSEVFGKCLKCQQTSRSFIVSRVLRVGTWHVSALSGSCQFHGLVDCGADFATASAQATRVLRVQPP